ncbi:hypothetical protein J2853_008902 [Streptosporangium lutulentum]|uniref:Uncharacterized protein n=1 Tax=Streptosporangium lutulentum TaxID=1461250 RepID=A0ABT9QSN0_9ACTN|nr:hypothetical protein [Streptosporangium lutulentum]
MFADDMFGVRGRDEKVSRASSRQVVVVFETDPAGVGRSRSRDDACRRSAVDRHGHPVTGVKGGCLLSEEGACSPERG